MPLRCYALWGATLALVLLRAPAASAGNITKTVQYALLQDYNKGADLNQVALDFQLMNALGIDTWRGSFGWDDYEPQKGAYDFTWLHSFANLAQQYGIKLRPYIAYTAPWAAQNGPNGNYWNEPPARVQDWYDFVKALSSAMKVHANILSYEIYNEVDSTQWWTGTLSQYNQMLSQGAAAIHSGNPNAQVIMSGLVFPDYDWVNPICTQYGNATNFQIAPFHAYPETWETSTVETYLDSQYYNWYVPAINLQCNSQQIWVNELGFANTPGKTQQQQAYWWARAFATFLADGEIKQLGIYQIRDEPRARSVIGGAANYHLGITTVNRTPKTAYYTVGMLVRLLRAGVLTTADADVAMQVTSGQTVEPYVHLFKRPDGHQILFVYDKQGSPTVSLTLSTSGTRAIAYALDGTSSPWTSFDGVTLSSVALAPGGISIFEIVP